MQVNRTTLGVVLIAALVVVGFGLTAATLTTTYASDFGTGQPGTDVGGGEGVGEPGDPDSDDDQQGVSGVSEGQNPLEIPQYCVEILTQPSGILGLVLGFGLVVGFAYWQRGFVASILAGYLLGLPMLIGYGLLTQCPTPGGNGDGESALLSFLAGSGMTESLTTTAIPTPVLAAIVVVATVLAIGALVLVSGNEEITQPEPEEDEEPTLGDFAAVAGEAADRIESTDASVDNAVYRAWQEMTELLEMEDPETSTPGQFSAAAIEAGLDETSVTDLTRLFEEVRYGDMDPEPREELAVETLRRIERTYGQSTSDGDSGAAGDASAGTIDSDRPDGDRPDDAAGDDHHDEPAGGDRLDGAAEDDRHDDREER